MSDLAQALRLDAPLLGEIEKTFLCRAIDSGFVSSVGPFVPEFEERFAAFLGVPGAVALQSGTAALHMALQELGIGPGDEVIVPALTFVATINPIHYLGATPVFAEVQRDTWTLDPQEIENLISARTKAVIAVHLYGNPCRMDEILRIARRHQLAVVEDATESLGANFQGQPTGTFGDFGCFSFNGNKLITTGGGGMIVGRECRRLDHIRFLANQARDESGCDHLEIGFNYRLTNLAAAIGLAQMTRLPELLDRKRAFRALYEERLGASGLVRFQREEHEGRSAHWMTALTLEEERELDTVRASLESLGVPTRRVFKPVHLFAPYRGCRHGDLSASRRIHERGLCLPSSTGNSLSALEQACNRLIEVLG